MMATTNNVFLVKCASLTTFSFILGIAAGCFVNICNTTVQLNYHTNKEKETLATPHRPEINNEESDRQVNWLDIFSFVPQYAVTNCSELFGGNSDLPEDIDRGLKKYTEKLKATARVNGNSFTARYKFAYKTYLTLAKAPFVRTICETGFNAGHSTYGWLAANPKAHVYTFDIGIQKYDQRVFVKHLETLFPGRLTATWGDFTQTLPRFYKENPNITCDMIIIDGGHSTKLARADLYNFRKMANVDNILILDNYPQDYQNMRKVLGPVWEKAKRQREVLEIFYCDHDKEPLMVQGSFGFSVGRYVF